MSHPAKKPVKAIAVYCSAGFGTDPIYEQHADEMGRLIGENGCDLVYGGGSSGTMGKVAKATLESGGRVIGVITHAFRNSAAYAAIPGVEEIVVRSLPQRKSEMRKKSDIGIALFGGTGTHDELFSNHAVNDMNVISNSRLPLNTTILVNSGGFYTNLIAHFKMMIEKGAVDTRRAKILTGPIVDTPAQAMNLILKFNQEGVLRARDLPHPVQTQLLQPKAP